MHLSIRAQPNTHHPPLSLICRISVHTHTHTHTHTHNTHTQYHFSKFEDRDAAHAILERVWKIGMSRMVDHAESAAEEHHPLRASRSQTRLPAAATSSRVNTHADTNTNTPTPNNNTSHTPSTSISVASGATASHVTDSGSVSVRRTPTANEESVAARILSIFKDNRAESANKDEVSATLYTHTHIHTHVYTPTTTHPFTYTQLVSHVRSVEYQDIFRLPRTETLQEGVCMCVCACVCMHV